MAFVCDDETEPANVRTAKAHARAVAPLVAKLHQPKGSTPVSGHSDAIVVVDRYGNLATVVHSINTALCQNIFSAPSI